MKEADSEILAEDGNCSPRRREQSAGRDRCVKGLGAGAAADGGGVAMTSPFNTAVSIASRAKPAPQIIFAFGPLTCLKLQIVLARRLRERGWETSFLLWEEGAGQRDAAAKEIGQLGRLHQLAPASREGQAPSLKLAAMRSLASVLGYRTITLHLTAAFAEYMSAQDILQSIDDPVAVVVSEDGFSANLRVLAAAKRLRIPIIDVPYGFHSGRDLEIDLQRKRASGEIIVATGIRRHLLRMLAPQWFHRDTLEFKDALMFPVDFILANVVIGARVRNPWTVHGGLADVLCVESDAARLLYVGQGVDQRKMVMTGSPYADAVARGLTNDRIASASFRKAAWMQDRARILVSWFPDYHNQRGHLCEFPTYEAMTTAFFSQLRELPADVTVSIHPACRPEVSALAKQSGFDISEKYIVELIPQHDIYVTYFSSTIPWAHASGKPVVNYDAYRLGLSVFDAPGFASHPDIERVMQDLLLLTTNADAFAERAGPQCKDAPQWGTVDGQACDRIAFELRARMRQAPEMAALA